MITTQTPYRISLFGGGTDYPVWFRQHGGAVLSATINRYCSVSCRPEGEEIHVSTSHQLAIRSGLGSSSAFAVGLIHAVRVLQGRRLDTEALAKQAIHFEQSILGEPVGSQDQVAAAFGGFNHISFQSDGSFEVQRLSLSAERFQELRSHLLLVHSGLDRPAFSISSRKVAAIPGRERELRRIFELVGEGARLLRGGGPLRTFGELMDESWQLKKVLAREVSTPAIDDLYERALRAGAWGGKILGAGGGGYLLLVVRPELRKQVVLALGGLTEIDFDFESRGSRVVSDAAITESEAGWTSSALGIPGFRTFLSTGSSTGANRSPDTSGARGLE